MLYSGFAVALLILSLPLTAPYELHFSGSEAYAHVVAQCAFGPRIPGSKAHAQTMAYIESFVREHGFQVSLQNFTYYNQQLSSDMEGTNIIASKLGGTTTIILGAHYDTRPFADSPSSENKSAPVPGADDGASGVAVLLELTRALEHARLNYTLTMVFLDAEDSGQSFEGFALGAAHYASTLRKGDVKAVIILDMVGDRDLKIKRELYSDRSLNRLIWKYAAQLNYTAFLDRDGYSIYDDHVPFLKAGIPAADIIDFDYPYWHTPRDTPDKVSAKSLEVVGRTVELFLLDQGVATVEAPSGNSLPVSALLIASAMMLLLFLAFRRRIMEKYRLKKSASPPGA